MSEWQMTCPDCGPQGHALLDAGRILEREFEGVWFRVSRGPDGKAVVTADPEDEGYLARFNMPALLKQGEEMAERDGPDGELYCPKCKDIFGYTEGGE